MSDGSSIEWLQRPGTKPATWNIVTGCSHVSPGCEHCFAERISARFGWSKKPWTAQNAAENVVLHPERLDLPLRWKKPRTVFVNSMSDLFHPIVSREFILAVWSVMEAAPQHTYIVLTKRPERMLEILGPDRPAAPAQPPYERRLIPGYPGYFADTEGAIWSERRGSLHRLSPGVITKWGHQHVAVHDGEGGKKQEAVHRLVLKTFDRAPGVGEESCHRDGNPSNNAIQNLYWGSRADNSADRARHGNAQLNGSVQLTPIQVAEIRSAALKGEAHRELGRRFAVSHTHIARIVSGEAWSFKVLPSVWLGVSVEDQRRADERIPLLLQTPAVVRWVSAEPLLGPVDLSIYLATGWDSPPYDDILAWVVAGGESGPGARPCRIEWIRSIVEQCQAAGVPLFVKQLGSNPVIHGIKPTPPFVRGNHVLAHPKGGDPAEWPEDLRVRDWPDVHRWQPRQWPEVLA